MDISQLAVDAEREKAKLQAEVESFVVLSNDFIFGVDSIRSMSTRSRNLHLENLTFRLTDDLLESVIAAAASVEAGAVNPAKRELRYILEQCVKYAFVDQKFQQHRLDDKLQYIRYRDVELVSAARDISLFVAENVKDALLREIGPLYGQLSEYVHPSLHQAQERLNRYRTGHYIGRHTAADVMGVNTLAARVYDIALLYFSHPLGFGLVGDVLINWWEDRVAWRFHYTPYMRALSAVYDYKYERKEGKAGPVYSRMKELLELLQRQLMNSGK